MHYSKRERCSQSFTFKEVKSFLDVLGLPMDDMDFLKTNAPLVADGVRLHQAFVNFATDYVNWAYASETDLTNDPEVVAYWQKLENSRCNGQVEFNGALTNRCDASMGTKYKYGLGSLTKANLSKQLAHLMFYVTGYHRVIGNFADYLEGGSRTLACVIRPGKDEATVLDYFGISTLAAFTGFPQINLVNDWRHVFVGVTGEKKTALDALLDKWQKELRDLSTEIEAENAARSIHQHMMNPRHLDSSIAI